MLPHRVAAASLDSMLERWPALEALLGVDRRKAQRSRANDSKRRGLQVVQTDGGVERVA